MSWTAPMTAVASTAFTAAQWNVHGRDNLNAQAPAVAATSGSLIVTTGFNALAERVPTVNYVSGSASTDVTTYTDLTSAGATVTTTVGTRALVSFGGQVSNNTAGLGSRISVDISGANTRAADDINSFYAESGNANDAFKGSWTTIVNPLTPGSTTFTLKYRTSGGGGTSSYLGRVLMVISF